MSQKVTNEWKKSHKLVNKSHKKWQPYGKRTQTCEKSNKKWQISEKKVTDLWKKVTKSDRLV